MALTDKLTAIAEAIRAKTGKSDSMTLEQMPTEIASITGGGSGGGSADGLVTVTFMNGDVELFSRPVYIGDDCPEPVAQGRFDAPTKESTAQYNYTFYGWGASDNGAADANILKNITEDKTVYAIFTATVRMYTITWLDSDGATVLKTEQVAYGKIPSYAPVKEGFSLSGWIPTPVEVTGDASYTAVWSEKITFANGLWQDIARISENGQAAEYFKIGDKKALTFTDPNGKEWTVNMEIVAFNHDNLADGTGKAGITVISETATYNDKPAANQYAYPSWNYSEIRKRLHNNVLPSFPAELQNAIKTVKKEYGYFSAYSDYTSKKIDTIDDQIWILSVGELGLAENASKKYATGDGTPYPNFQKAKKRQDGYNAEYFLRSMAANSASSQTSVLYSCSSNMATNTSTLGTRDIVFGFCI